MRGSGHGSRCSRAWGSPLARLAPLTHELGGLDGNHRVHHPRRDLPGAIAKALLPGDDPGGFIVTTIIGIVGALLGGFLAAALFGADPLDEFFDISTWLTAIVGSIVLLLIYRAVAGRAAPRATV